MRISASLMRGIAIVTALASCTSGPGPSGIDSEPAPTSTAASPIVVDPTDPGTPDRQTLVVIGPAGSAADVGAISKALEVFSSESGVPVEYVAVEDINREFSRRLSRNEVGDVFLIDSLELLLDAAIDRKIRPIPRDVDGDVGRSWSPPWTSTARIGELLYGAPVDAKVESLLWYHPSRFAAAGYDVPSTWIELVETAEEMIDDDQVPFCGFDDEAARTRGFIDWTFDLLLRSHEPAIYDGVISLDDDIEFDDRKVFAIWESVRDLWITRDVGFATHEDVPDDDAEQARDRFEEFAAGECSILRGGPEVAGRLESGTAFADGTPDAVDVILFPGPRGNVPVIADVTYAVARHDVEDVWSVIRYLGSAEFARDRRSAQAPSASVAPAFVSAAAGQDLFQLSLLELSLLDITTQATEVRESWDEVTPAVRKIVMITEAEQLLARRRRIDSALRAIRDS